MWLLDLGITQKTRPALIMSVGYGEDDRVLVTVISHTTSIRGSNYEVDVKASFLKEGAFLTQSIMSIHPKYALKRLGKLNDDQLALVEKNLLCWLGIKPNN